MNSVILAFNAVFPLLAFMVIGYCLRRAGLLDAVTAAGVNKLVFRVFLPLSIFQSVLGADIKSALNVKVACFTAITCVMSFMTISAMINSRVKDKTIAPVMIQGIHKANYNLLAVPIVSSFFGNEIGMAAVLIAVITPIANVCSTLAFESARGGTADPAKLVKKLLLNPMVLSSLLGLAANLAGLKIPALISTNVMKPLASMATPAAMLSMGSGFDFSSMKRWARHLTAVCAGKLVILPGVIVSLAVLLGIRGADLIAILIYSGSPAAVNSYSTAVSMGGNEELAGDIVALTSLLSILTLFLFLSGLGLFGLL